MGDFDLTQLRQAVRLGRLVQTLPTRRSLPGFSRVLRERDTITLESFNSRFEVLLWRPQSLLIEHVKMLLPIFLFILSVSSNEQTPPIGIIDFYGLSGTSEQQARAALQIKEGDALPESLKEAQNRLEAGPNVEQARLNIVCCEAGKLMLYVGIKVKGSTSLQFRPAPNGAIRLPENIVKTGEEFQKAVEAAVLNGDTAEDDSQGHALAGNPRVRSVQERFITFAAQYLQRLRNVLRESSDAQHRALAGQIIAYTANKQNIVGDLLYGMSDPDEGVRNNSMRALKVLALFAMNSPQARIRIPWRPFVEMLNSVVWTDRNKASLAVLQLTEKRNAGDPLQLA